MPEHKVLAAVVVLSAFAAGALPAEAAFVIDDFSAPVAEVPTVINLLNPNPTIVKTSSVSISGGERDVLIDVKGAPVPVSYAGAVGGGSFMFGSFGSPGTVLTLQYDGLDADVTGPPAALVNAEGLGLDLTSYYNGLLYLHFLSVDAGDAALLDIQINVHSLLSQTSLSAKIPENPFPMRVGVMFAGTFPDQSVLQNVTSIEVILNSTGTPNVDFQLDAISIVPEPATLSLLGLGAVALFGSRRTR